MLYEVKKIVHNKFFVISTLILIGYFIFFAVQGYRVESISPQGSQKYYEQLPIYSTEDMIYDLEQEMYLMFDEAFSIDKPIPEGNYGETLRDDYVIISKAVDQIKYSQYYFKKDMMLTVEQANEKRILEKQQGNTYQEKYNQAIINQYNKVKEIAIFDAFNAYAWFETFHFLSPSRLFSALFIIWVVFTSAYIFNCEKMQGAHEVAFSTVNGRKRLLMNKLVALFAVILGASLLFLIAEFLVGLLAFRVTDFFVTIQSIPEFQFCPFDLSILGGFLLMNFMRMLALLFTAVIMAVLSIKAKSLARPLAAGFLIFGAACYSLLNLTGLNELESLEILADIRSVFPLVLSLPEKYFMRFDHANILGLPMNRLVSCSAIFAIVSIICIVVSTNFYGKAGKHNG